MMAEVTAEVSQIEHKNGFPSKSGSRQIENIYGFKMPGQLSVAILAQVSVKCSATAAAQHTP